MPGPPLRSGLVKGVTGHRVFVGADEIRPGCTGSVITPRVNNREPQHEALLTGRGHYGAVPPLAATLVIGRN
jgi:hypothetical protein